MAINEHQIPPWTRMPCDECGVTHQATRTMPGNHPFVCPDCQSRQRGRLEGLIDALGIALATRANGGSLPDAIAQLEKEIQKCE